MSNYRSLLPNESVFPKAHYLEEHMVAFARQWRVGPGILGEHGAESVHSVFNKLLARFASMPVAADRLKQVMKAHLLQANPATKPPPQPKHRKEN